MDNWMLSEEATIRGVRIDYLRWLSYTKQRWKEQRWLPNESDESKLYTRGFHTWQVMLESKWDTTRCMTDSDVGTMTRMLLVSDAVEAAKDKLEQCRQLWCEFTLSFFYKARMEPSKWTGIPCVDSKDFVVRVDYNREDSYEAKIRLSMSNDEVFWSRSQNWLPPLAFIYEAEMKGTKVTAEGKWRVEIKYSRLSYTANIVGVEMDYHRSHDAYVTVWTAMLEQWQECF